MKELRFMARQLKAKGKQIQLLQNIDRDQNPTIVIQRKMSHDVKSSHENQAVVDRALGMKDEYSWQLILCRTHIMTTAWHKEKDGLYFVFLFFVFFFVVSSEAPFSGAFADAFAALFNPSVCSCTQHDVYQPSSLNLSYPYPPKKSR